MFDDTDLVAMLLILVLGLAAGVRVTVTLLFAGVVGAAIAVLFGHEPALLVFACPIAFIYWLQHPREQ